MYRAMKMSQRAPMTALAVCLLFVFGLSSLVNFGVRASARGWLLSQPPPVQAATSKKAALGREISALLTGNFGLAALTAPLAIAPAMPMTGFTVNDLGDTNPGGGGAGAGTTGDLRYCITQANLAGGTNTISFTVTGTINLAAALPSITNNLTITGPGADQLTVRRDTGGDYRIFNIPGTGLNISISGLTISNGKATAAVGGGIFSSSSLTLNNCVVSGNEAGGAGGGVYLSNANGIFTGCTFSGNKGVGLGGGIEFDTFAPAIATLDLSNCTISGNTLTGAGAGGGITNFAFGGSNTLNVTSCTIVNNTVTADTGGLRSGAQGAGTVTATTIRNSIIANNAVRNIGNATAGGGVSTITSQGYNLTDTQITGCSAGFLNQPTDKNGVNPLLGPLQNNGGPTPTHALLAGSPALDMGNSFGLTTDQRGLTCPVDLPGIPPAAGGDNSDIGAFEAQSAPPPAILINDVTVMEGNMGTTTATFTVTLSAPAGAGGVAFDIATQDNSATTADNDYVQKSLTSQTIPAGNSTYTLSVTVNGDTTFEPSETFFVNLSNVVNAVLVKSQGIGTIQNDEPIIVTNDNDLGMGSLRQALLDSQTNAGPDTILFDPAFFSMPRTINLASVLPTIRQSLTITGPGANLLTVRRDTGGNYRIFTALGGNDITITISGLTISNGKTTGSGGGIVVQGGNLTLTDCAITGNEAFAGGGVFVDGKGLISGCTISGNTAGNQGGGINYQGLFFPNQTLRVINSTISGNTANGGGDGGGILLGVFACSSRLEVVNCTIVNNITTTIDAGGIDTAAVGAGTSATTVIQNSIIANNTAPNLIKENGGGTEIVTSLGNNLTNDNGSGFLTGPGDLINTNPLLAALGNYGGPTQTHALLPGSPAINAGNNTGAPATDQRGIARPKQTTADIGAFESQGFTLAIAGGNNQITKANTTFANPLSVMVTANDASEPVNGGQVTFTPPGSGASATIAGNPATIASGVATSGTVTANAIGGTYNVAASTIGAPSAVNFSLTNDIIAPTASLSASNVTTAGGMTYTFTVAYSDNIAINVASLTSGDVQVTGPGGFNTPATFVNVTPSGNGTPRTATYSITPPGGSWDQSDFGTYTITMVANEVFDTAGNAVAAGSLGTFQVVVCPSTLTVNNLGDTPDATPGDGICATSGGVCTLRAAIMEANAIMPCTPLTINFSVTGTINLATALPALNHPNLTINGPGANQLNVHRNVVTAFRIFSINSGKTVNLTGLTISNGDAGTGFGGGIFSSGNLSINNCAISGNHAGNGGGIWQQFGTLNITNSTISGNTSTNQAGGINIADSTVSLTNCTISGNSCNSEGGGMTVGGFSAGTFPTTLINCTITNNTSGPEGNSSGGGGIAIFSAAGPNPIVTCQLKNTLVAGNMPDNFKVDLDQGSLNATYVSLGNNLDGDGTSGFTNGVNGDLVGTSGSPLNALLAPLANYGGLTQTHALLPGSPAINAGTSSGAPSTDQRGFSRVGAVDIGAFESQGFTLAIAGGNNQSAFVNTNFANPLSVTVTANGAGEPVNGGQVKFTPPGSGASASVAGNPATIASGVATSGTVTANGTAGGPYNVAASANGAASSINFSLTNISPPTVYTSRLSDPIVCLGPGSNVTGTIQLNNPNGGTLPFTLTTTFANMVGVAGSCVVTNAPGATCNVTAGGLTASGNLPANTTLTVQYLAQVSQVPGGATVTASSTATLGGLTAQPAQLNASQTVNCPTVGPGAPPPADAAVSDQKPGSVLFYNLYTSNPADLTRQNTRINLTNTDPSRSVAVHLFFVDGATCTPADSYLCLTPNQTVSFLASDIDPGTTGYIIAVASDPVTGCPINFNFLIGDEFVKLSSGHAANLAAESFAALAGGLPLCNATAGTATLNFDGVSYNQVPRVLAVDNFPSTADGNNTLLILNRVGGDLASGASTIGALFGVLYDESEQPLSFTLASNTCQLRGSLNNSFLRTTQRLETVISAGRTGWLRLWGVDNIGLLGSVINLNASAGVNNFSQGHNLHKLTFTTSASLTIPIIPPACQ